MSCSHFVIHVRYYKKAYSALVGGISCLFAGVVAWAVSAEVVMGAHRESALKASEAFRLSQVSTIAALERVTQLIDEAVRLRI